MSREMTAEEIRTAGLKALLEALGPSGMLRFLEEFAPGEGDYTAERRSFLEGVTLDELIQQTRERKGRSR